MRPGGRPKPYSNGVHWVNSGGRKRKVKKKDTEPKQVFSPIDFDHDGTVTPAEAKLYIAIYAVTGFVTIIFACFLIYLAILGMKS